MTGMHNLADASLLPASLDRPPLGMRSHAGHPPDEPLSPAAFVMAVIAAGHAALLFASIIAQTPILPMRYMVFGYDVIDFWTAARDVVAGLDPYARPRFVTPPPSVLPFLPLASLSHSAASMVFFGLNVAAISAGLIGLRLRFRMSRQTMLVFVIAGLLSPCTLMLLERGNVDGLVFMALSGFFFACERRSASVVLAAATCLKAYPAVFVLALIAHRRTGAALIAVGIIIAVVALTPHSWMGFVQNQIGRTDRIRIDENLSPLALVWFFGTLPTGGAPGPPPTALMVAGSLAYAVVLAVCLWLDWTLVNRLDRPNRTLLLASYAIFCIGMPSLVFLYSGIVLFVLVAALGSDGLLASPGLLRRMAIAIGCVMLPAKSFSLTLGTEWAIACNLIAPTASLVLLIYAVLLRIDIRRALAARGDLPHRSCIGVARADRTPPCSDASIGRESVPTV